MLADSFALCGNKLVETLPAGGEYLLLPTLSQPFDEKTADIYLTILVSHFDNVGIDLPGVETVLSERPVYPEPTLVFEKVDEEKALHIRLQPHLCRRFLPDPGRFIHPGRETPHPAGQL